MNDNDKWSKEQVEQFSDILRAELKSHYTQKMNDMIVEFNFEYKKLQDKYDDLKAKHYNLSKRKMISSKIIYNEAKYKTYLMKDNSTGYYKIGRSIDPIHREKTLQCEKPSIKLVKVWDNNIELKLHKEYASQRLRGEWFKLSPIQVKYICSNTFN